MHISTIRIQKNLSKIGNRSWCQLDLSLKSVYIRGSVLSFECSSLVWVIFRITQKPSMREQSSQAQSQDQTQGDFHGQLYYKPRFIGCLVLWGSKYYKQTLFHWTRRLSLLFSVLPFQLFVSQNWADVAS
jgi:hypothetical protein